jgi:hypothetical protein
MIMSTIGKVGAFVCITSFVAASFALVNLKTKKELGFRSLHGDPKGFAVIELFTSEGCSSCPPADELIAQLQKDTGQKQIYILAYHVDYWDRQGWKDAFSDGAFSKRQSNYADWLLLNTIYTPQIILNGKTGFVGSDKPSLFREISVGLKETPKNTLTLTTDLENEHIRVEYQTDGTDDQSNLVLALIQKSGQSKVRGGENSGHTLNHVQIVRKLTIQSVLTSEGKVRLDFPKEYKADEWELIGLIQNKKTGAILAAARSKLTTYSPN